MSVDDSYTKALLHLDGADGSTTIVDESGKSWSCFGNAQLDTAQYKFGTASGLFDGAGDRMETANSTDFQFGTGDFTIDFWMRIPSNPAALQSLYWFGSDGNYTNSVNIFINGSGRLVYGATYTGANIQVNNTTAVATNTWTHVAFIRYSSNIYLAIGGVLSTGVADTHNLGVPNSSPGLRLGCTYGGTNGTNFYNGWIDEVRISKGIARWTSNFTPPSSPYVGMGGRQFQAIYMG
jgi:hypothetical protein